MATARGRVLPAAWLARGLWLVVVAGIAFALVQIFLAGDVAHQFVTNAVGAVELISLIFATVGAVIASNQPRNRIGWIFLAVGVLYLMVSVAEGYFAHFQHTGSWLPGAGSLLWLGLWSWMPALGLLATFVMLLFPDGRLPSQRWWPLGVASAVVLAVTVSLGATAYWGIRGLIVTGRFPEISPRLALAIDWGEIAAGACMGITVLAVIDRFRHARGEQRQQLKWFTYGSIGLAAGISATFLPTSLLSIGLALPGFLWFTSCVAVAILRFRLYDIDVIVNRTLVYGGLTALLGGVYIGAVFGLGALVRSIAGHGNNGLVVAASTLAVAALFSPARRGLQAFIDRRFYRRKYDAARTLERFGARLRDDVDLDELSGHLVGVVRETMQPAQVSLWLRNEPSRPLSS